MKAVTALFIPVISVLLFPLLVAGAEPQALTSDEYSFGWVTQTDGQVLVTGAPWETVNGNDRQGAAYVYELEGGEWQQAARLVAADGAAADQFGSEVAVDGNVVLVAAPYASVEGLPEAGAVYVFERDDSGTWIETVRLVAEDPTTMARFGTSIGLDGNRAVIAAPDADVELGETGGAAYIFDYDPGTAAWQQSAKLSRDMTENFATSVDVSGDRVAIASNNSSGIVYTYRHDGSDWSEEIPVQPANGIRMQVELEGEVLAVGAPADTVPDRPWGLVGRVHVYERATDAATWEHVAVFQTENPVNVGEFGRYLDLNDGLIVAAGTQENGAQLSLIRKDESGEWVQTHHRPGMPRIDRSIAVSARILATGGPEEGGGQINVYDMAELLSGEAAEEGPPADEPADDPADDQGTDDNGTDNDDSGGEDIGSDDGDDSGAADDDTASDDTGGDTNDTTGDAGSDSRSDSGGGIAGWLPPLLLPLVICARRRKQQLMNQG